MGRIVPSDGAFVSVVAWRGTTIVAGAKLFVSGVSPTCPMIVAETALVASAMRRRRTDRASCKCRDFVAGWGQRSEPGFAICSCDTRPVVAGPEFFVSVTSRISRIVVAGVPLWCVRVRVGCGPFEKGEFLVSLSFALISVHSRGRKIKAGATLRGRSPACVEVIGRGCRCQRAGGRGARGPLGATYAAERVDRLWSC